MPDNGSLPPVPCEGCPRAKECINDARCLARLGILDTRDAPASVAGRPYGYTPAIGSNIAALVAQGLSMREIGALDGFPVMATIINWLHREPAFLEQYLRAKKAAMLKLAEECLEIADDGTNDWMERHNKDGEFLGYQLNGEHVARSKLRVDARVTLMERLAPKVFGKHLNVDADVMHRTVRVNAPAKVVKEGGDLGGGQGAQGEVREGQEGPARVVVPLPRLPRPDGSQEPGE